MEHRIKAAVRAAVEAVKDVPEELRAACCGAVLQYLLTQPREGKGDGQDAEAERKRGPKQHPSADLDAFMGERKPANDWETALVIAYHREEHAGLAATTKDDLDSAFSEVARGKMKRINEPAQVLRDAKRDGYMRSVARGKFALSNKGKKYVEEQLPKAE